VSPARSKGRERQEKILHAIYEVAEETTRLCDYEDIVVRAWQLYPEEFGLRGYTSLYPDASDLHKPLYGPLKREGLVRSQNKKFGLTEQGLSVARRVVSPGADGQSGRGRIERHQRDELTRLGDRPAIRLVLEDRADQMLDTDFYDFYGVTVRTAPADFAGRVATVDGAIEAALEADDPSIDRARVALIVTARNHLREQFADLLAARTARREKSRH
jgi:hypothetical protein